VITEVHLTLSLPARAESALRDWMASHPFALPQIELSGGVSSRQTMLTTRRRGSLADALQDSHAVREALSPLGIAVTRTKLEQDHAATGGPTPLHVEHHVKITTLPGRAAALSAIGAIANAHLSRNPFRSRPDAETRFFTQRFAAHDGRGADAGLDALLAALAHADVRIERIERERVVHDDNLSLDDGWKDTRP
jgi:hypothetical protein